MKQKRTGGPPLFLGRMSLAVLFFAGAVPHVVLADPLFPNPVFETGTQPLSIAVGDFNGDGRPDLAVANDGLQVK